MEIPVHGLWYVTYGNNDPRSTHVGLTVHTSQFSSIRVMSPLFLGLSIDFAMNVLEHFPWIIFPGGFFLDAIHL